MFDFSCVPVLLAQAQETQASDTSPLVKFAIFVGIVFGIFVLPFLIGNFLAGLVRMRDYGFKIGIILSSLFLAVFVLARALELQDNSFEIPLGVDLKGGVILIYEIDTTGNQSATEKKKDAQGKAGEEQESERGDIDMDDLVQALTNRINPAGTKEIVIRPYGDRQVEIIIPEVETEEVEEIKRQIRTAGQLEFRIVANRRDHEAIIAAAEAMAEGPRRFQKRVMMDGKMKGFWAEAAAEKLTIGELADTIMRNSKTGQIVKSFTDIGKVKSGDQKLEDFLEDNNIDGIDVLLATDDGCNVTGDDLGVVSRGTDEYLSPCVNFRLVGRGAVLFGELTRANQPDKSVQPPFYRHLAIMLDERLLSFPRLQSQITDSGRITGKFTTEEVDFLVGILRAGRLPATLQKEPISENQIGSMLGDDTIRKGKFSIMISLLAVLFFVAVYYRFAGLVACAALLINLVLIMALMVLLNAPLTLPGLAGLVLTIGMSVDANVLIFERIREEVTRGAALRMAIRNGFARATTTIVDANVTTLITAMVLYAIGTDQIRGFAVTLIFGIVMSMYTAIFCSRVVFDIAERRRWISELKMMRLLGATKLNFLGRRQIAIAGSILLILIGLVAVGLRGREIFDIDFNGGLSVTIVLEESMPPDEVRSRLNQHFQNADPPVKCSVNTVSVEKRDDNTVYKIDADIQDQDVTVLEDAIMETFRSETGESLLLVYDMQFSGLQSQTVALTSGAASTEPKQETDAAETAPKSDAVTPPAKSENAEAEPPQSESSKAATEQSKPAESKPAQPKSSETPAASEAKTAPEKKTPPVKEPAKGANAPDSGATSYRHDLPPDSLVAWAGPGMVAAQDETEEAAAPSGKAGAEAPAPADVAKSAAPSDDQQMPLDAEDQEPDAPRAAPTDETIRTTAQLELSEAINAPTLRAKIRDAYNHVFARSSDTGDDAQADEQGALEVPGLMVAPADTVSSDQPDDVVNWDQKSAKSHKAWKVIMLAPQDEAQQVLVQMQTDLENTPVFPSSSKIGGKVAGDTKNLAIAALIASLFGIVGYIWIRFQRVVFGVAAVIALVHDILITLGAIAVSAYLAKPFGFLLIDEFRISLPIVAAFLTIIGYSLNDTIVVFDRIREVRGKSPDLTSEMINTSINQTLSRTLLTSLTTLIVVSILYAIGGQGIHGFAFALVVGVLVGTYSSIFIASPALLWLFNINKGTA